MINFFLLFALLLCAVSAWAAIAFSHSVSRTRRLPHLGPLYARCIASVFTKPKCIPYLTQGKKVELPFYCLTVGPIGVENNKLLRYKRLCGYRTEGGAESARGPTTVQLPGGSTTVRLPGGSTTVRLPGSGTTTEVVPTLYLPVLTFRLVLWAIAAPGFPISALGGVTHSRPLRRGELLMLRVSTRPGVVVTARGHIEVQVAVEGRGRRTGDLIFEEVSTILAFAPKKMQQQQQQRRQQQQQQQQTLPGAGEAEPSSSSPPLPSDDLSGSGGPTSCQPNPSAPSPPPPPLSDDYSSWQGVGPPLRLRTTAGPQFAALNGDFNPIHVHPLLARAFGFRSNIAHGMMVAGCCVARMEATGTRFGYPRTISTEFVRPTLLPCTADIRYTLLDDGAGGSGSEQTSAVGSHQGFETSGTARFVVLDQGSGKLLLRGSVRAASAAGAVAAAAAGQHPPAVPPPASDAVCGASEAGGDEAAPISGSAAGGGPGMEGGGGGDDGLAGSIGVRLRAAPRHASGRA